MKLNLDGEERALLCLSLMLGPSSIRVKKLLELFDGSARQTLLCAAKDELPNLKYLTPEKREQMRKLSADRYIDRIEERLEQLNVKVATLHSKNYPQLLKEIYDPPMVLYYKGTLYPQLRLPIAIVGTREPSEYGKRVTFELAKELVQNGACIISGMAHGLDRVAAEGAMAANSSYPTVAVLGTGPNIAYPKSNEDIYVKIIENGAVISEFMPGTAPLPANFPMRNRIISGMARGIVVVEAREKSGTAITVDCALEQGRDVFAVPGRITDEASAGTNSLLREGTAKITLGASDILEEYGITPKTIKTETATQRELSDEQALICKLLRAGERNFDELAELTGFDSGKLNSTLTELEFSGIIKQLPGRLYQL